MEEPSQDLAFISKGQTFMTSKKFYFNWLLVMVTAFNNVAGYSMSISTLYNFVTNPQNQTCSNPGLGESETTYAVAAGMYHGGIMIGAIISSLLAKRLDYRRLLTVGPLFQAIGGVIYATSSTGWMVILARLLIGMCYGISISSTISYFTVSATEYYHYKQGPIKHKASKINRLKKSLMILFGFINYLSYIPLSGLVSLVSQFFASFVNQFRWIGWFQASCSVTLVLFILYTFTNSNNDCFGNNVVVPVVKETKKTAKSSIKWQKIAVIAYLIMTGYTLDSVYAVLDTMISLVLSDYFGFSVKFISYFFTGILIIAPCSPIFLLISQKFGVSSRLLLLIGLIFGTCGLVCMGDWQSILYGNECNILNTMNGSTDTSIVPLHDCADTGLRKECVRVNSDTTEGMMCPLLNRRFERGDMVINYYRMRLEKDHAGCPVCSKANNCQQFHFQEDNELCTHQRDNSNSNSTGHHLVFVSSFNISMCLLSKETPVTLSNCSQEDIEAFILFMNLLMDDSMSEEQQEICESQQDGSCYWNQDSVITGTYCTNCPSICRSKKGSLSFPQVCLGAIFTILSIGMGRHMMFPILTKTSPSHLQELTTSLLVLADAFSCLLTPIWTTLLYTSFGRTTYVSVSIMLACQIPVYIGFCLFHKQLTTNGEPQEPTAATEKTRQGHRPSTASILPLVQSPADSGATDDSSPPISPLWFLEELPTNNENESEYSSTDENTQSSTFIVIPPSMVNTIFFETPL